jgi:hypothetical protein
MISNGRFDGLFCGSLDACNMYSFVGDGLFIGGVGDRTLFGRPVLGICPDGICPVDPAIVLMFWVCIGNIGLNGGIIGKPGMFPIAFWLKNSGLKKGNNGDWSCCVAIDGLFMFTGFHNGLNAPKALDGEASLFPFENCSPPPPFTFAGLLNMDAKESGLFAIEPGPIGTVEPPWAVGSSILWYTVSRLESCGKLWVCVEPFNTDP